MQATKNSEYKSDNTKTMTENNKTYNTDDDALVITEACILMNGT